MSHSRSLARRSRPSAAGLPTQAATATLPHPRRSRSAEDLRRRPCPPPRTDPHRHRPSPSSPPPRTTIRFPIRPRGGPSRRDRRGPSSPPPTPASARRIREEAVERWDALADREARPAYRAVAVASSPSPSSSSPSPSPPPRCDVLSDENRRRVADWCYAVADSLAFDRRIVAVAFSHLGRRRSRSRSRSSSEEETEDASGSGGWLEMLACLQLAIKLYASAEESSDRRGALRTLRAVCRLSEERVAAEEWRICHDLEWHLHPPVPASYLDAAAPLLCEAIAAGAGAEAEEGEGSAAARTARATAARDVVDLSRFLAELAVYDPDLSDEPPSSVAHAAVRVAMDAVRGVPAKVVNEWLRIGGLRHSPRSTDRCVPRLRRLLDANSERVAFRSSSPTSPTTVG